MRFCHSNKANIFRGDLKPWLTTLAIKRCCAQPNPARAYRYVPSAEEICGADGDGGRGGVVLLILRF